MIDIKFTLWFNKKDLTVRNEMLMSDIYLVDEYDVEENLEMISIKFHAPYKDRKKIMDAAFNVGASIVSIGEQNMPFLNKEKLKK